MKQALLTVQGVERWAYEENGNMTSPYVALSWKILESPQKSRKIGNMNSVWHEKQGVIPLALNVEGEEPYGWFQHKLQPVSVPLILKNNTQRTFYYPTFSHKHPLVHFQRTRAWQKSWKYFRNSSEIFRKPFRKLKIWRV